MSDAPNLESLAAQPDAELTAAAPAAIAEARRLVKAESGLPLAHLLYWAGARGYGDLELGVAERQVRATARARREADGRPSLPQILWQVAALEECEHASVALYQDGQVEALHWSAGEVRRGSLPHQGQTTLQWQARLSSRQSDLLSHYADKELMAKFSDSLERRARFYPGRILADDKLWTWPFDFSLVNNCYFTSYTLVNRNDPGSYFAVAHPWSHGGRFFISADGAVLDLYARSGEDASQAPGNFWHAPGLIPATARRLGLFRQPDDNGIDVSPPRSWGRNTYLVGCDEFLLPPVPTRYGNPPVSITMRPLRVRQLFLQEDRDSACYYFIPVRHGVAFDVEMVPHQPGGVTAVLDCPLDLPTTATGFALAKDEAKTRWIQAQQEELGRRASLLQ